MCFATDLYSFFIHSMGGASFICSKSFSPPHFATIYFKSPISQSCLENNIPWSNSTLKNWMLWRPEGKCRTQMTTSQQASFVAVHRHNKSVQMQCITHVAGGGLRAVEQRAGGRGARTTVDRGGSGKGGLAITAPHVASRHPAGSGRFGGGQSESTSAVGGLSGLYGNAWGGGSEPSLPPPMGFQGFLNSPGAVWAQRAGALYYI